MIRGKIKGSTPFILGDISAEKIEFHDDGNESFILDTGFDVDVALPAEVLDYVKNKKEVGYVKMRTSVGFSVFRVFLINVKFGKMDFDAVCIELRSDVKLVGTALLDRAKAKVILDFFNKKIEIKEVDEDG